MTNTVVVDQRFESEPAKRVLKYRAALLPDPFELDIPVGASLLHVEFAQSPVRELEGHWLLWYEVPLESTQRKPRVFQALATGVAFPKCAKYCATGLRYETNSWEPSEVWHLYEYPSGAKVVDV